MATLDDLCPAVGPPTLPPELLGLNLTAKGIWLFLERLGECSAEHSYRELSDALNVTHGAVRGGFFELVDAELLLILGRSTRRRYRYRLNIVGPLGPPLDTLPWLSEPVRGAPLPAKVLHLWLGDQRTVTQSGDALARDLGVSVLTARRARRDLEARGLIDVALERRQPRPVVHYAAGGLYG